MLSAQYDRLPAEVDRNRLTGVHDHPEAARDDVLAFTASSKACGGKSGPTTPTNG